MDQFMCASLFPHLLLVYCMCVIREVSEATVITGSTSCARRGSFAGDAHLHERSSTIHHPLAKRVVLGTVEIALKRERSGKKELTDGRMESDLHQVFNSRDSHTVCTGEPW